ncbi:DUF2182 domain-containing protein [Dyella sp. ASV21]|uniref:copper chaperone n=1 Tax=Dyella sp. ASV21 TaxID=2795114 RepID=UPI0018EE0527
MFALCVVVTTAQCLSMSGMGAMPMPGGWMMSMPWLRMCGQGALGALASFMFMWSTMTVAMMLPSLAPLLRRYRDACHAAGVPSPDGFAALLSAGYFLVWLMLGLVVYVAGLVMAGALMQWPLLARAAPGLAGMVVMVAGALQFTAWKARRLVCCRAMPAAKHATVLDARSAWRYGWRLGFHCVSCCSGMTAILLVTGVMDLRVMPGVTAAITLERLSPSAHRAAWAAGALTLIAGATMTILATRVW